MAIDYIYNGQGFGDVADRLLENDMNPAILRPWISKNGRRYITVNGQHFLTNAPASLPYEAWRRIDGSVQRVARPGLRVWGDLVGAGLTYDVPNGMGTTVLTEQTMTDAGAATISMDALKGSERDRPQFDIKNFPLPIVHGEFSFSARQLAVARASGAPLDTTMAEMVTRRIVEQVEALTIGTAPTYSYGGGTVYGMTNHPARYTKVLTLPTALGWTPETTYNELLDMIVTLQDHMYNGPYGMYFSPAWVKYLAQDYSSVYPGVTLNSKLGDLRELGLSFARKLMYGLSGFQVVMFQLSSEVIRAVQGMPLTTLQWDSKGGLAKNFKIMAIMVPQVRTNASGETGIVHGVAA